MNTLIDRPVRAYAKNARIHVEMQSGLALSFPVADNPRLAGKTDEALSQIEISPLGLHWPELDEDLSIRGILAGDYGQRHHHAA